MYMYIYIYIYMRIAYGFCSTQKLAGVHIEVFITSDL